MSRTKVYILNHQHSFCVYRRACTSVTHEHTNQPHCPPTHLLTALQASCISHQLAFKAMLNPKPTLRVVSDASMCIKQAQSSRSKPVPIRHDFSPTHFVVTLAQKTDQVYSNCTFMPKVNKQTNIKLKSACNNSILHEHHSVP